MRWISLLLPAIILFAVLLLPTIACGDSINFVGRLQYTSTDTTNKNKTTGEKTKSDFLRLDQRYNLDLQKTIYPYLTFSAGTFLELDEARAKSEGSTSTAEERVLSPYVGLRLTNPLYQAGVEYRRTERNRDLEDTPNTEDIKDDFNSFLGWRPEGLPEVNLRYNIIHSRDHPETIDEYQKFFSADTNYAWRRLQLEYLYFRVDTENRLTDFDTLNQTHIGRVDFSQDFFDGRLSLFTNYRIDYNIVEFSQGAVAEVPLQRTEGLFSLDNTPEDGPALQVNNALIDGNLVASAGIDIGLGGDETILVNIGVDLGATTNVDQIRIWVDRRLSDPVANSFSWEIYASPDNTNNSTWVLVDTVDPANFATFENRFEILFPQVSTRFIKVVTRPLLPGVPDAVNFPNIFVTEMQAFVTVVGAEVDDKITTVDQRYNLGLRTKLSAKTVVGYNLFFLNRHIDPGTQERTQLSNDVFVNHVFNQIFSSSARVSREDSRENNEDTVTYNYSAFLKGAYMPTFGQTLTFSGRSQKEEDDSSDDFTVTLRNDATLYRGWSAFVDSGYEWTRAAASDDVAKSILIRAGTNFEPHRKLSINLNFRHRRFLESDRSSEYEYTLNAFFLPFNTLSLDARVQWIKRQGPVRTFQSYAANWSPFPDGDLQFFFVYTESLSSESNQRDRTIGPGLNWDIGPHFSLDVSYNVVTNESNTQKTESNRLFTELQVNF